MSFFVAAGDNDSDAEDSSVGSDAEDDSSIGSGLTTPEDVEQLLREIHAYLEEIDRVRRMLDGGTVKQDIGYENKLQRIVKTLRAESKLGPNTLKSLRTDLKGIMEEIISRVSLKLIQCIELKTS